MRCRAVWWALATAAFLLVLSARPLQGDCGSGLFVQATTFPTGERPRALATGDFNGDGHADFAILRSAGIAVLLGDGEGGFGLPIPTAYSGDSLAVGRFDADSKDDLVVGRYALVAFLHGNGDGTFAAPAETPVAGSSFTSIRAARVDGDDDLDVVATSDGGTIAALRGNGSGGFSTPVTTALGVPITAFEIADFNGDDEADLAVTHFNGNSLSILLGNGTGSFSPASSLLVGTQASRVGSADFNGDGKTDLVFLVGQSVAVTLGNGNGSFQAAQALPAGPRPDSLVVGDFDADGKPDAAVSDNSASFSGVPGGLLYFYYGNGTAIVRSPGSYLIAGNGPLPLAGGDWNHDGRFDFASTSFGEDRLSIVLALGERTFLAIDKIATAGSPTAVSGDFDGDGSLDVVIGTRLLQVLLNRGDGTFRRTGGTDIDSDAKSLAAADINGDGKLDLIAVVYQYQEVLVLLGRGDGSFGIAMEFVVGLPSSAAVGDWDADGVLDLAIGMFNGLVLMRGNGDGTFSERMDVDLGFGVQTLVATDWNGDGRPDLLGAGGFGPFVSAGRGNGTFEPPAPLAPGVFANSIAAGDLDGDGSPDAVLSDQPASVLILFADGSGGVRDTVSVLMGADPVFVKLDDLDGDDVLDIATANRSTNDASVLLGLGGGAFAGAQIYDVGGGPAEILSGDFTGSGIPALLTVNPGDSSLSLLRSTRLAIAGPVSHRVCPGESASFAIQVAGLGPIAYQWRRGGVPLSNGGRVSGASGPVLTITSVVPADEGIYDAVVTHVCGPATSGPAELLLGLLEAPHITAAASVAPGAAGLRASVPGASAHTYQWSLTGGAITGGQGTSQITYSAGPAGTTMSLSVVDSVSAACTSDPGEVQVQVDFLDVPAAHLFHNAVVSIARAGITTGCGGGKYCPDLPVSRDQMSVFILRGEHGGDYQPPVATGTVFSDVSTTTPFAKWMEQFGDEGISTGCGPGSPPPFCPTALVTRDAAAVFLLRGKNGAAFDPPAATGTVFGDVQTTTFLARWMEELKAEGITQGCGGGNYCPGNTLTRGEMAALLKKTFGF